MTLSLNSTPQRVDEGELAALPDTAAEVAGVFAALRDDIVHGRSTVTGFDHPVGLTRLIADLLAPSSSGRRTMASGWLER